MTHIKALSHKVWYHIHNDPHIPTVLVSQDKKCITIRGSPIMIADIPRWYKNLLKEGEELLDKALLGLKFPEFEELIARRLDPKNLRDAFVDNHGKEDAGYSFLTDNRNELEQFEGILLKRIYEDDDLRNQFFATGPDGTLYSRAGKPLCAY
jgi:hypothetical protein